MRALVRTAAVAAVVVAVALPAQAASPPAGSAAGPFAARVVAAARYAAAHGDSAGIAVLDTTTGHVYEAGHPTKRYPSASVVKVLIATRLLLTGQMHGHTATLATAMIRRSDNAAAWSLYPKVGRDGLLPWIAKHYTLSGLGARPAMKGIWGSTQLTAGGLVRLYAKLRADHRVWPWLSRQMHAYAKKSAAGEPNAFGLAAAVPSAAVKNGWDTNRDPKRPHAAIVNTTGFAVHDRYAVAILTEGPGKLYYRPGEAIVTHLARLLFPPAATSATAQRATTSVAFTAAASGTAFTAAAARCRFRATQCHSPLVVLDPGHNGANAQHTARINRLVNAGYGRRKACNTTGTQTNHGYPEHAFNWDVAQRVARILRKAGVRVSMTRANDHGVGPCVNRRAAIESGKGVAAAVAIHADGAGSSGHGFHVNSDSRRPVGASKQTVRDSSVLTKDLHDALQHGSGLVPSTYIGHHGYVKRSDLAGLNLTTKPTTFLELGNMRNAHDAHLQSTAKGRQRIAAAVAQGILRYLER